MYKVLIPFTEPDGGERAVRHLLKEPPRALQVELLAIIEATGLHTSRRYISAASAEEASRATAMVWIAKVAPILQAAGVPYKTHCDNVGIVAFHAAPDTEGA